MAAKPLAASASSSSGVGIDESSGAVAVTASGAWRTASGGPSQWEMPSATSPTDALRVAATQLVFARPSAGTSSNPPIITPANPPKVLMP